MLRSRSRKKSNDAAPTPRDGQPPGATAAKSKLPSYQFYIVLALFDVAVIVASILAQHQTLQSFNEALADVQLIHERHRWLTDLAEGVIKLNAPGNDVFASRDPDREEHRFVEARIELRKRLESPPRNDPVPPNYSQHVSDMTYAEEQVFTAFREILQSSDDPEAEGQLLVKATAEMAKMDRAQAEALAVVTNESLGLLDDQQVALRRHEAVLNDRTRVEFIFVLIVALILGGVTWYWRQLQRMRDTLLREHARAETERRNRLAAVGEVCFSVAHGIRNPVAAIASSAQLVLEYGEVDDRSKERVRDVVTACRNLTDRVGQLLSFSREGRTSREAFSPQEVLDQAVAEVERKLDAHGIAVQRRYDASEAMIEGDRNLLVQAVIEMLSNAMDELKHGGMVTLVCSRRETSPDWIEFGVIDDGPGIPDETKERACELFFSRKEGGSGVGLASIRRAAELHDGVVLLSDAEPSGADVRIRLPVLSK